MKKLCIDDKSMNFVQRRIAGYFKFLDIAIPDLTFGEESFANLLPHSS